MQYLRTLKLQNINSVTDMTDTTGISISVENNNPAESVPKVFADSEIACSPHKYSDFV